MANTKRDLCADVTNSVCKSVNDAVYVLQESACHVNGFGILFDVQQTRYALAHAKELIDQALNNVRETSWPTNAEYDTW